MRRKVGRDAERSDVEVEALAPELPKALAQVGSHGPHSSRRVQVDSDIGLEPRSRNAFHQPVAAAEVEHAAAGCVPEQSAHDACEVRALERLTNRVGAWERPRIGHVDLHPPETLPRTYYGRLTGD